MDFKVDHAIKWMDKTCIKIEENKAYLTSLDQVIGDGDHGLNMARGFNEVIKKLKSENYQTVSDVMKDVAMTVISKVGGASGPLLGTAFLKMSLSFKKNEIIDYAAFVNGLDEGLNGIMQRGKATTGEKTLLDVWSPVVEQLKQADQFHSEQILVTAREAMDNTRNIMATKGRAAYFKERSIGHIDPGSASSYYLFAALAEVVKEEY